MMPTDEIVKEWATERCFCACGSGDGNPSGKCTRCGLSVATSDIRHPGRTADGTPWELSSHIKNDFRDWCRLKNLKTTTWKMFRSCLQSLGPCVNVDYRTGVARGVAGVWLKERPSIGTSLNNSTIEDALLRRIRSGKISGDISVRELHRKHFQGRKIEDVKDACEELERLGWLRLAMVKPPVGRPSQVATINPPGDSNKYVTSYTSKAPAGEIVRLHVVATYSNGFEDIIVSRLARNLETAHDEVDINGTRYSIQWGVPIVEAGDIF